VKLLRKELSESEMSGLPHVAIQIRSEFLKLSPSPNNPSSKNILNSSQKKFTKYSFSKRKIMQVLSINSVQIQC